MLIKNKFNGYAIDGTRLYNFGGGGGGTSTSYTSNIPEYAQPYVETMLGAAQKQLFNVDDKGQVTGFRPYAAYGAVTDDQGNVLNTAQDQAKAAVAGFSPLQKQAQSGIANMQVPGQTGAASRMTADLAGRALSAGQYDTTQFTNQYTAPDKYKNTQFTYDKVAPTEQQGGTMTAAQMTGPADVSGFGGGTKAAATKSFTDAGTAASYMSPYTQAVTDIQTREAQRAADIAATQRGAQAAQQGAFGGSRQAIMEAEAARNLATQKGDITAKGQQDAYQQAMAQFNAEQGYGLTAQQANLQAGLQSALANQQAGLTTGTQNLSAQQQANVQNLAAKLQTQGLNAQQAMQAALANQTMGMTAQQAAEQSKQYGYGQEMAAAQQTAQYGLAAQQAQEQSKQFGAGLGMQGVGMSGQMANQLGNLGQQQYGQQMGIYGAQAQAGGQQQQLEQARINQAMQNYATQQQYPLMQLGVMSNMLRGLPMQSSTTGMYAAQPSAVNQIAGSYGAYDQFNKAQNVLSGGKAAGGIIKKMAAGGIASGVDPYELPGMSKRLSDQQLSQKMQDKATDPDTKGIMQGEIMRRAHVRGGMANGGVVAFAGTEGSEVKDKDKDEGIGGRGAESKGGIPAKLLKFLEGDSKEPATKHGPSYRQEKNTPTNVHGRGQPVVAVTPDVANTSVPLGLAGSDKGARPDEGKYVNATAPAPLAAAPKAAPAAPRITSAAPPAAPSPAGDPYESLLKASLKSAGQSSPEATAALGTLKTRAGMTPAQHYAETEGFRKEMGVDTKAMLEGQRETQRGMSEDVEKRGKYAMHMRNAQMFAKIASTPGPLLASAAKAMNDVIPEMIEDAEKQEKAQNEIKKALAALDMSEYLDKAGKADKALESRNSANVALMSAQMEIDKAKQEAEKSKLTALSHIVSTRESGKSHERAAAISASARAGGAGGESKLDLQRNKAADAKMAAFEKGWAKRLENIERYAMAPEGSAPQKQADKMRKQYEQEKAAKEREIAAEYPSEYRRGAPTADATDADIEFTAKKHNMTVDQVKAKLGIK